MITYPAKIIYDKKDRAYLVEFPDLPGCVTFGTTLEEAQEMARDALTGYLASIFERNYRIPEPSMLKGENIYNIEPEAEAAIPIALRRIRRQKHLSQEKLARKLKIEPQTYQRLENPRKFNPTYKKLKSLEKAIGKKLIIDYV